MFEDMLISPATRPQDMTVCTQHFGDVILQYHFKWYTGVSGVESVHRTGSPYRHTYQSQSGDEWDEQVHGRRSFFEDISCIIHGPHLRWHDKEVHDSLKEQQRCGMT